MNVGDVVDAIEAIAPPACAEPWDKVGLAIGSRTWPARRVLLTIDLTEPVLDEAIDARAQMILAYHPPIFEPLASLTDAAEKPRIALRAARAGISVYSPHTALDAASGGVNDWLAGGLGAGATRALSPWSSLPADEARKIVTFCPVDAVDAVREAMAAAGAGRIDDYEQCSFEIRGTGTFHGGAGTTPAVGKRGQLERVEETRLEMVCSDAALSAALAALRSTHPYETPPIEVHPLEARPDAHVGPGRHVTLDRAVSLDEIAERIKKRLGVNQLHVAVARPAPRSYTTVGLCAGAGGSLLDAAIRSGCRMFLTGEMRHHDVLAAQARGCTVVLAGHTNTERGYLKPLRRRLAAAAPKATFTVSKRDRDPLKVM